jgi:hypothetical protein
MKAYWGSGGKAPLILWLRHWMEVSGQFHASAALPQGSSSWYPLDRRLGEPQSRSGRGSILSQLITNNVIYVLPYV